MGRITRRPRAGQDLIDIWTYISGDDETAADHMLDRIDEALETLADRPLIGRMRPELAVDLRRFPIGRYVLFYRPAGEGIDLIRVLSAYRDISAEEL